MNPMMAWSHSEMQRVQSLVNTHRVNAGSAELSWSDALAQVAQSYSNRMASERFFSHVAPDGPLTVSDRVRGAGVMMDGVGENLARLSVATPEAVVDGWLDSPGHCANLLDPAWRTGGVGAASDDQGNLYFTHIFGTPPTLDIRHIEIEWAPIEKYLVKCSATIGAGNELVGFVDNAVSGSSEAGNGGTATLEVVVPTGSKRAHVSFATGKPGSINTIGIMDGWLEEDAVSAIWRRAWTAPGAQILDDGAFIARSSELRVRFTCAAYEPLVVVLDGKIVTELSVDADILTSLAVNEGTGRRVLDFGRAHDGCSEYVVKRRFELDSEAGTIREISPSMDTPS